MLRQPRLRRVHGAWSLAITADQLSTVVLTVFAYDADGIAGAGVVSAVRAVPAAAAGPLVGRILNRFAENRVLVASLTVRVACTAVLAQRAAAGDSGWLVYALAAADAGPRRPPDGSRPGWVRAASSDRLRRSASSGVGVSRLPCRTGC